MIFELTINEKVYGFRFGMGFVREVNKRVTKDVDGVNKKQDLGLQYAVAGILDRDPIELADVLVAANKTEKERVTRNQIDSYIDDENTDIDALFEDVLDFLSKANATKKTTENLIQAVEEEKKKAEK